MVIPKSSTYIPIMLHEYHNTVTTSGHGGDTKTYLRLTRNAKNCVRTCKEVRGVSAKQELPAAASKVNSTITNSFSSLG